MRRWLIKEKEDRSFSQWGMFDVPSKYIEIGFDDLGFIPEFNAYISEFSIFGAVYRSYCAPRISQPDLVAVRGGVDGRLLDSLGLDADSMLAVG